MVGVGLLGLLSKLHKWDDSAMFFDGTSLGKKKFFLDWSMARSLENLELTGPSLSPPSVLSRILLGVYVFGVAIYISVIIPMLQTIVDPTVMDTKADRTEAMRVLSAANIIIMVCLFGILALQVSSCFFHSVIRG
jgi:hypothetical protein